MEPNLDFRAACGSLLVSGASRDIVIVATVLPSKYLSTLFSAPILAKSNNYVYSDGIYLAEKYIHKSGIPGMNGQLFPPPRLKDGQQLKASHSMLDILGERGRDIYTAIPCG
ncbi:hypothetical protein Btru_008453 [Bulinus truncatus]|nr:hypothetical protein Btru_008453 [Bulinus truncatus]